MNDIKVMKTVYPTERISEEQWMKEFNVGKRLLNNPMDSIGVTFGEFLEYLKKNYDRRSDVPMLSGKNI